MMPRLVALPRRLQPSVDTATQHEVPFLADTTRPLVPASHPSTDARSMMNVLALLTSMITVRTVYVVWRVIH